MGVCRTPGGFEFVVSCYCEAVVFDVACEDVVCVSDGNTNGLVSE